MPDILDLLKIGKIDHECMVNLLNDEQKAAKFGIASKDLEILKTLEPDTIRSIVDAIDKDIDRTARSANNGCNG